MRGKSNLKAQIMLVARLYDTKTDEQSREAYEMIYDKYNISQSKSFYLWLFDLLKLNEEDVYLDISCGRGQLVSLAQQAGFQAHGADLSLQALRIGQEKYRCRDLIATNSQQLPYKSEKFSVVSNIGSLEHYVDMPAAIRESARVLKPKGLAYILVPNTFSLINNVWFSFRNGRTSIDPYQPIQRYAARYEWQELLEDNGLKVKKTIKYERVRPRTWADFVSYLNHPKELAHLLLTPLVPLNLAFCFIFICQKNNGVSEP